MTKRILIGAMVLAAAASVAAYVLRVSPREGPEHAGKRPQWDEFKFQRIPGPKEQQFVLVFRAAIAPGAREERGRVLFAMQDRHNYYFAEISRRGVSLGKVENGFEWRIGTRASAGLRPDSPVEVTIKRHSAPITIALDGAIAATAYDDTFGAGDLAFGSIDNSIEYKDVKVQPISEIYRTDDFMRNEGEQGLWETVSGNWQVNAINNPTMSTNAFYYIGSNPNSPEATVTWGFWFWDNYSFRVACKPLGDKAAGIYSHYRDKDNYYLFKWTSCTTPSPKMQLIRCVRGKQAVLAEKAGGYTPNQWYLLQCDVVDGEIRAFIDDQLMLEATDTSLCLGKVGLYVDGVLGAQYDDALVRSIRRFKDAFQTFSPGRWTELGGSWRLVASSAAANKTASKLASAPQKFSLVGVAPDGSAKVVSGESRWADYILSADIGPSAAGRAGLCFYYQDELNYYALLWDATPPNKRELVKVMEGKRTVLASDVAPSLSSPHRITIALDKGHILVQSDGHTVFEEFDNTFTEGKIGLIVERTPEAYFADVRVEFPAEKQPLMTVHEVFSRERTMEDWAGEQSDWASRTDTVAGVAFVSHWHRADFPGDVDMEMKLPANLPNDGQIKMMLGCDGENLDGGYCFTLTPTPPAPGRPNGGLKATFTRRGQPAASAEIPERPGPDQTLLFRRIGTNLVAYLGSRAILTYRDREPLKGVKIGWAASNVAIKNQDIEVYSNSVQNYSFKEAASDWRIAAGIWEVTNRWQCDPRWSFFCGRSPRLAAIWNKRELVGDVTLEFYAAIKMDAERGRRYEYASDMNCTLCADGKDLTSGYNFLFGGWRDQRSAITKGDKILVETSSKVIPREDNIHRRWFYLKARKHGNRLEFHVDNNLILEYVDPQPLTGTRAAIWTYNNGLMVSRVRLSCTDASRKESPILPQPPECKCVYDTAPSPTTAPAK